MKKTNKRFESLADWDLESSVIGTMLYDRQMAIMGKDMLEPAYFFYPDTRVLFQAIVEILEEMALKEGRISQIDVAAVYDRAAQKGYKGALTDLLKLLDIAVPVRELAESLFKRVKELYLRRELYEITHQTQTQLKSQENFEEILQDTINKLHVIADLYHSATTKRISAVVGNVFTNLRDKEKRKGLVFPLASLEQHIGKLQDGDYVVVAGRPGMGKTAFALDIALRFAAKHIPVTFFSLEMSAEQLAWRILAWTAEIPIWRIRNAKLDADELEKIAQAVQKLEDYPIYIEDTPHLTTLELRALARKAVEDNSVRLLIIDYIQLLSSPVKRESRQQEMTEISRQLKLIAKELKVPIIALSQLSRAVEQREDKRPRLSDLRESGAIEQDADIVMFLYRPGYYDKERNDNTLQEVELIVSKHRHGPTGAVQLLFYPAIGVFDESAGPTEEEIII